MASATLQVSVWRTDGHDEKVSGGAFQQFDVPSQDNQTVLDVVTWIQQNADPTLSYRFACRVGMCGSCAMTVNGVPRWTCRTHVKKVVKNAELKIAPLDNLPVIKDLVCDLSAFFDKWIRAEGVFHPTTTRHDPMAPVPPQTPARRAADDAIECINCAVCYAACDSVAGNPDYLGPAALNRSWSLLNDVRDGGQDGRLAAARQTGGCQQCHSMGNCMQHCPNGLNPTRSIAGLKQASLRAAFRYRRS